MFVRMKKFWGYNIKMDLREIMGWEDGRWLEQAQGCVVAYFCINSVDPVVSTSIFVCKIFIF
jgi:hypothetical protein